MQSEERHMNTPNLNRVSDNTESQTRITSHSSIDMPTKKRIKKAQGAFRTISEVANKLDVQQHVLRFWETKFSQVRPLKRGGGRRYYRPEDVALLERIHHLLYTEGYTIKGVQKLMKGQGKAQIIAQAEAENENTSPVVASPKVAPAVTEQSTSSMSTQQRAVLEIMLAELKTIRSMIAA